MCAQKVAAVLGLGSYSTVFSSSILALWIEQNKSLSCLLSNWCMLVHVGVCWCIIGDCQAPTLRERHWWWGLVSLYYSVILSWGETVTYKKVAPQIGRTCYCSWPGHFSHVKLFPTEVVRDFGGQCMWLWCLIVKEEIWLEVLYLGLIY